MYHSLEVALALDSVDCQYYTTGKRNNLKQTHMTIKPVASNLVLKNVEPEVKTKSGLFIPETAKEDKTPNMAEVIAVGTSKKIAERGIKKGDWVIYSKYAGTEVDVDDTKFVIVSIKDVLAKIEK